VPPAESGSGAFSVAARSSFSAFHIEDVMISFEIAVVPGGGL
jgi:hypothetical protein